MRQGWESEAQNWVEFARTPCYDRAHDETNMPALLDLLPAPGRATLDVACGEGRVTRTLRSLGHRVVGIDASPTMVQAAGTHVGAAPVVLADAIELPFRDAAFDVAVAYMCLHDIDDMPRAVAEIARVLGRSGRLCVAIPHPINTAGSFQSRAADAPFVISGSYLQATPLRMVANRSSIRLTFHSEHRPLESYARALETSGLLIEAVREVTPPDDLASRDPPDKRWQRVPLFLHLLAIKP
jgi:SAM-dependent methyltransferase